MKKHLTRRTFLREGMALGIAGAALPELLAACGGSGATGGGAGRGQLPAYVAPKLPPAQLPGTSAGVEGGYWQTPANPVQSVHHTPGNGGTVTALVITYNSPPTPYGQNEYWKGLSKRLGTNYQPLIVSQSDYPTKLATTMASEDLPDFLDMYGGVSQYGAIPHITQFLESKCVDLTPYLAGDAAKAYPNLAAVSTFNWRQTVYNGRIYGLPQPQGVFWEGLFILQNLADEAGISHPRNADEFERLMKELNRPKQGRWALGGTQGFNYNLNFFYQVFGVPNQWHVDGNGRFTADLETPGAEEAVAFVRKLVQDGVFHPQTPMTTVQAKNAFNAGQIVAYQDGMGAYSGAQTSLAQTAPGNTPRVMVPFGHNGGKGSYFFGIGTGGGFTALKKASRSRVQELLRVANWMAAPFGTVEYLYRINGVEGVDFTLDPQGNPVQSARGKAEVQVPNFTGSDPVIYQAGKPDWVKAQHEDQQKLVPIGVPNPTVGVYSETIAEKGSTLRQMFNDQVSAIISGRAPMSSWKSLVDQWRSEGGNTARDEYQRAWEKSHKGGGKPG